MTLKYNASSNAYEREGYEPVSKEDVMSYLNPSDAPELIEPLGYDQAMEFVENVRNGTLDTFDDNVLSQFVRGCRTDTIRMVLATFFVLSEKEPDVIESFVSGTLSSYSMYGLIVNGGYRGNFFHPSDTKRAELIRWMIMLGKQDPARISNYVISLIRYAFSHSCQMNPEVDHFLMNKPILWSTLFHFARIEDPDNVKKVEDAIVSVILDNGGYPLGFRVHPDLILYVRKEMSRYRYGLSLFDRLWYSSSLEKNE